MDSKRVKICHIASVDMTVKLLLMPQLKFLMGLGYDVYAVCSPGSLVEEIEKEGIRVKSITIKRKLLSPVSDIAAFFQLYFYFKKEKFDIVHTHAPKSGLLGQLAAKLAGVPIVINTIHGLYFTENFPYLKRKVFIFIEKISALCSALIFSQNKEDIQTMISEKIAPAQRLQYLGNGIDMGRFDIRKYPLDIINQKKQELGLPANAKIIGTVGRLVKEKGYLDLFEAMKVILQKYPNALLLAIGPKEPDKKDALNPEIVKEYGLQNNVIFLGERKDVEQLYPLMDVFVLASHREGFPRSVIEAMAMERPIVVTDIRGCREEIEHNKNGLMVPMKNPEKLAEAVVLLLENPTQAQEFAKQAKLRAQKEFDEKLVFEKINKEYSRLIQERIR